MTPAELAALEDFGTWVSDENGTPLEYQCTDGASGLFDLNGATATLHGTSSMRKRTLTLAATIDVPTAIATFSNIPGGASDVPAAGEGSDEYICKVLIVKGGAKFYSRAPFKLSIAETP